MKIKPRLYAQALAQTLYQSQSEKQTQLIIQNFSQLLRQHRQIKDWPKIARLFDRFYSQLTGQIDVHLASAHPLSDIQQNKIFSYLQKEFPTADMQTRVSTNPQLLGGFTVHAQDHYYDATVQSQLQQFLRIIESK